MSKFFSAFKKVGGKNLIVKYWKQGVLFYAFSQLLLTGGSQKALELLRRGVGLKFYKKLKKKNIGELIKFNSEYEANKESYISTKSDFVWVSWMQGIEDAPLVVKKCYESIKKNIKDKRIVLITSENVHQYANIPDYIYEKYQKGIISHTHFSDLLRIALLAEHGGTWIDLTVFCSGSNIPSYMLESEFFVFQQLKPGSDGSASNMSSWFMTAYSNQKFILAVRHLLWSYWKVNDSLIDYFLLHNFFAIVSEYYQKEWNNIIPYSKSTPHILLLRFFEPFDIKLYEAVTAICPFHKLSYKFDEENLEKEGTYYKYIMSQ